MAVVGRVVCKAIVWNVPDDVALGQRKGFMVAKANSEDGRLWYYGCYETDDGRTATGTHGQIRSSTPTPQGVGRVKIARKYIRR